MYRSTKFPEFPENASSEMKEWAKNLQMHLEEIDSEINGSVQNRDDRIKKMFDDLNAEIDELKTEINRLRK